MLFSFPVCEVNSPIEILQIFALEPAPSRLLISLVYRYRRFPQMNSFLGRKGSAKNFRSISQKLMDQFVYTIPNMKMVYTTWPERTAMHFSLDANRWRCMFSNLIMHIISLKQISYHALLSRTLMIIYNLNDKSVNSIQKCLRPGERKLLNARWKSKEFYNKKGT